MDRLQLSNLAALTKDLGYTTTGRGEDSFNDTLKQSL